MRNWVANMRKAQLILRKYELEKKKFWSFERIFAYTLNRACKYTLKTTQFVSDIIERETAIGYKKAKTNRNWVQILHFYLHFYHAKTVNIDMRRIHVPNTNLGRHERN